MTDASSARTAPNATRLLLLSNSATSGQPYLSHALDALAAHLSGRKRLLFIPYARFRASFPAARPDLLSHG